MKKDPAVLFYIDTWLISTAEMDSDVRGWYLNLILHQYDKKDLPNDVEKLATLAGVSFSEYERFKQVFEQVFKQKFNTNENGRLENEVAKEILRKREEFKEKRSNAGKLSYFLKYIIKNFKPNKSELKFIRNNVNLDNINLKDEQALKQVFKQMLELYTNGNGDGNRDINGFENVDMSNFSSDFFIEWEKLIKMKKWKKKSPEAIKESLELLSKYENEFAIALVKKAIAAEWQGVVFDNTDENYKKWKIQKYNNNKKQNNYDVTELFKD